MTYKILLYCPDNHITYNLHTLDHIGVGGGITARLRMAHALANLGHKVTVFINCPQEEIIQGVSYHHYSHLEDSQTDIAIFSSSGGELNFKKISFQKISAQLKILMVHGDTFPGNISPNDIDFVYSLSNFVREIAINQWEIDPGKVFVSYRGVVRETTSERAIPKRDPFKLVYFGHPSKGLDAAVQVLKILRQSDPRFSLHVFGGNRLWGMSEEPIRPDEGLIYHGLIGQKELAARLHEMSYSINLQSREEPFGMVVTESMHAGCVVLASPVGAYPEIIKDGWNGFLIPGRHSDPETHNLTANKILDLMDHPNEMDRIRDNAISSPLSWETIARSWIGHWNWALSNVKSKPVSNHPLGFSCSLCNGPCFSLSDGLHCLDCGNYQNSSNESINLFKLTQKWDYKYER
jgi:glycosyltransferase involved in cell wall biosynthesis